MRELYPDKPVVSSGLTGVPENERLYQPRTKAYHLRGYGKNAS